MHKSPDNNYETIIQFLSPEEYNSIPEKSKNSIRLIIDSLYDGLMVFKNPNISEISFNADGKLWAYGHVGKNGKILVGMKRPIDVPIYHPTEKTIREDKFLLIKDDLGRKIKKPIPDDYIINGFDEIHVEHVEVPKKIVFDDNGVRYLDRIDADKAIKTLATFYGTQVHELNPILEVEIPVLGQRFSGIMPPCEVRTSFSLRTKAQVVYTLQDYVDNGTLTDSQKLSLLNMIKEKKNILVVGGTGSGKTTFCNALLHELSQIDPECRVAIIEDVRELKHNCDDSLNFLVPPVSVEITQNMRKITTDVLLKATMRRSPDRIVLGEIRDGDTAANLLSAWNSGHPGGMSTIHADDAASGLLKFEQYLDSSSKTINPKIIAATINVLVSIQKTTEMLPDGTWIKRRKVEEVLYVDQYVSETKKYYTSAL